jgi:hypothetical protein
MTEDQVQWHRAWAEMQRWLEEFELKHVELKQCVKSFWTIHVIWSSVAAKATLPGEAAFARWQSAMYLDLHNDAKQWLIEKGLNRFVDVSESEFIQAVRDFREQELGWLNNLAGNL